MSLADGPDEYMPPPPLMLALLHNHDFGSASTQGKHRQLALAIGHGGKWTGT